MWADGTWPLQEKRKQEKRPLKTNSSVLFQIGLFHAQPFMTEEQCIAVVKWLSMECTILCGWLFGGVAARGSSTPKMSGDCR